MTNIPFLTVYTHHYTKATHILLYILLYYNVDNSSIESIYDTLMKEPAKDETDFRGHFEC